MNPFYKKRETCLEGECFDSVAYDGCYFYFPRGGSHCVEKFDKCFKLLGCYDCVRAYSKICYDFNDDCFWASALGSPCNIYKLDKCFSELDCLCLPAYASSAVVGLARDYACGSIIVTLENQIISINKDSFMATLLQKNNRVKNQCALVVCDSFVSVQKSCQSQSVDICDRKFCLKSKLIVPKNYCVISIALDPRREGTRFYILCLKDNNSMCVLQWIEDSCNFCDEAQECDCDECDDCDDCDDCQKDKYCAQILKSVACSQTAISHILNAEGEKIQKILACSCDVDKILCVNKSVQKTIIKVTHLEIILHDTLALATEICCGDCDDCDCECECEKDCDCDCDCQKDCECDCQKDCDCECQKDCDCDCQKVCDCDCEKVCECDCEKECENASNE